MLAPANQFRKILSVEGAFAGEDLVEHEAERIDVAAGGDLGSSELLGCHVGRRARTNRLTGGARQAEVGDAHASGSIDHHVGRLEVAMHDAPFMRRGKAGADLPGDFESALLREAADPAEQRRQVLAVHVLHREERVAVHLVDVVDAADVRMGDLARHPDFGVELGQARRIAIDVRREELERDRLAEFQVIGAEHFTHPAATEPADDPVASAEKSAGRKTAVVDVA